MVKPDYNKPLIADNRLTIILWLVEARAILGTAGA